jgi:hypothetical protein
MVFDNASEITALMKAIIIFRPSYSSGRVRIKVPDEITSRRFLNLVFPDETIP